MGNAPELAHIKLGLERIRDVLERLGNPQSKLPPVIHIAGTNGKGSTAAFLTSIFQTAGYKVHRYTTPHLVRRNERILLANEEISDAEFDACLHASAAPELTPFEHETAAMFLAMSRVPADVAIIEVGLGGRLDSTNVVRPALTIITPISIDHTQFLGDTIEKIAFEKAGIIKKGVPCVVGKQMPEAMRVIDEVASLRGTHIVNLPPPFTGEGNGASISYKEIVSAVGGGIPPSLPGAHQIDNARTAATAALALREHFPKLTNHAIEEGIRTAKWPGRLQQLAPNLWLDGGHNAQGGEVLAAFLEDKPHATLICGMMSDKDTYGYLQHLKPVTERLIGIAIPGEKRSHSAMEIATIAKNVGIPATHAESLEKALKSTDKNATVIICGSLYLVGYVLGNDVTSTYLSSLFDAL